MYVVSLYTCPTVLYKNIYIFVVAVPEGAVLLKLECFSQIWVQWRENSFGEIAHLALWRQNNILEEILWRVVCWSEKKWCFYCLYTGLHMVLNASKEESLIDIQTFIFWRLVKKEMVMVGNIMLLHWCEFAALFSTKLLPHFILFILYAALIKIKIKSFSHVVWKKNEKEVSSATSSETI